MSRHPAYERLVRVTPEGQPPVQRPMPYPSGAPGRSKTQASTQDNGEAVGDQTVGESTVAIPATGMADSHTRRVRLAAVVPHEEVCGKCATWRSCCYCDADVEAMRAGLRKIHEIHATCDPRDCPEQQRLAAVRQARRGSPVTEQAVSHKG